MKEWLKSILPAWLKYILYRLFWDPARRRVWRSLKLKNTLRSGISVRVIDHSDWIVYNEVIVNGEYDSVIHDVLNSNPAHEPLHVLDLGANVGYFSFRFADLFIQQRGTPSGLSLTLAEGSPTVSSELQRRVSQEPLLANRAEVIHGLVGKRNGGDYVGESYIHYGQGISSKRTFGSKWVPYVDLVEALKSVNRIALLKCDIEGSEFDLIQNYPSIFQKVSTAVFEFHYYGKNVEECRKALETYGLRKERVLRSESLFSIESYHRY